MKRILLSLTVLVSLVVFATPSFAAWSVTQSRHNFGGLNSVGTISTTGTKNVCVFCHTPHASNTGVSAPIWNRQVGTDVGATYTMYSSPTLDSSPGTEPDGVSLACLSCHDGTVALDALVNAPGSGGLSKITTASISQGWAFTRGSDLTYGNLTTGTFNNLNALSALGTNIDTYIPFLGTDLTNDHPISMNYAGKVLDSGDVAIANHGKDPKFEVASQQRGATGTIATVNPRGTATFKTAAITDGAIRLFDHDGSKNFKVQCASCHNPHGTQDAVDSATAYPTFLQKTNDSSSLCVACHIK